MDSELDKEIKFQPISPFELIFERISVIAKGKVEVSDGKGGFKDQKCERTILKECSGKFSPKTVTAILGPSGSGKTTMLNLLSGRLLSDNLILRGELKANGKPIDTMAEYKGVVGYVMQEDLMLPTFTPTETFRFITDMRLANISDEKKNELVESMIDSLGLRGCASTYVGNTLIKGLSGGEKKRTSVGVELLINPSLIFLDEPTTGLDSTTALNLIKFLNRLAHSGRTVVTTIHQPSSEIFLEFDHILLLLDGNIIYQNRAQDSMAYFNNLNFPVPIHSNPMDHYMKLMNKEGISLRYMDEGKEFTEEQVKSEFDELVKMLVTSYKSQEKKPVNSFHNEIKEVEAEASWLRQSTLLFKRTMVNELRNPIGFRAKIFMMIFFAIIVIILYERKPETLDSYIQNVGGLLFFMCMNICMSSLSGSLHVFLAERAIFIRERQSNTYVTSSYYIGRSLAYFSMEIISPIILISISYFAVNLQANAMCYFLTLVSCWLASWMASAFGLLISAAFSNPDIAPTIVPAVAVPLMLLGGFFASLPNTPKFYYAFQYLSMFKYQFQAIVFAQFYNREDGFTITLRDGSSATYNGNILAEPNQFYFKEPYWLVLFLLAVIGSVLRLLAFVALWFISNPKNIRLLPPSATEESNLIQRKDTSKPLIYQSSEALGSQLGDTA